jgi:hypothetical protein
MGRRIMSGMLILDSYSTLCTSTGVALVCNLDVHALALLLCLDGWNIDCHSFRPTDRT